MLSATIVSLVFSLSLIWNGLFGVNPQTQGGCIPYQPGLEIPEETKQLSVCLSDPVAPENGIITSVSVEYAIDHPNPDQLEIRLSKIGAKAGSILWEPGNAKGAQFGKAVGLQELVGESSAGDWVFEIRDTQPGKREK